MQIMLGSQVQDLDRSCSCRPGFHQLHGARPWPQLPGLHSTTSVPWLCHVFHGKSSGEHGTSCGPCLAAAALASTSWMALDHLCHLYPFVVHSGDVERSMTNHIDHAWQLLP